MYWKHRPQRPTTEVGAKDHPWHEGSGRHWAYIVAWGSVAAQVEFRLWRFSFGFTLWRSYDPD